MLATSGANFGYRGALPVMLGIQAGSFVLTFICCMGLGTVFTAWPLAQQMLREPRKQRVFNLTMGCMLFILALLFLR